MNYITKIGRLEKPLLCSVRKLEHNPVQLKRLFESEFNKDIYKKFMDIPSFKKVPQDGLKLLARFGNIKAMLISCALGGGLWNDSRSIHFTDWFKKTYANEITLNQQRINDQQ